MGTTNVNKHTEQLSSTMMIRDSKDFAGNCLSWVSSSPEKPLDENNYRTIGDIANTVFDIICDCIDDFVKNKNEYVNRITDFVKRRKLTLEILVFIIITMGPGGIQNELGYFFEYSSEAPTKGAYTRAINRLQPNAIERLFREINRRIEAAGLALKTYRGFRLIAIDSSSINVITNHKEVLTLVNGKFNQTNLHALFDVTNGYFPDGVVMSKNVLPERDAAEIMLSRHPELAGPAIILEDRGYISLNHLAFLLINGFAFLIRSKDILTEKSWLKPYEPLFKQYMKDEEFDVVITIRVFSDSKAESEEDGLFIKNPKYKHCKDFKYCGDNKYFEMNLRIIRHMLPSGTPEILVSNISPAVISHEETKSIYYFRWFEEGEFRHLKYYCDAIYLHHTVADRYTNEIYGRLIMANYTSICVANSISVKGDFCEKDSSKTNGYDQPNPADVLKGRADEECSALLKSGLSFGLKDGFASGTNCTDNQETNSPDRSCFEACILQCATDGGAEPGTNCFCDIHQTAQAHHAIADQTVGVNIELTKERKNADYSTNNIPSLTQVFPPEREIISMNADMSRIYILRDAESIRIYKLNYSILCKALYHAVLKKGQSLRLQKPANSIDDYMAYASRFLTQSWRKRPPEQIPPRGKSHMTYLPPLAYRP